MRRSERRLAVRILASAGAVLLVAGCATKGDMRNLQRELRTMTARQDSLMEALRREARSTQDTVRQQSDQLFDFRGDISRQLRQINESLARLEANTGENQRGIAGIRDQLANTRRLPSGGAPQGEPANPEGEAVVPGVTGGQAEETFNAGVRQFNRGSVTAARTAFQNFLTAHPTHALAPDAHYYLADLLVQENRPEDALEAFRQIPELFPTANKVPDALYRIGLLHAEMGNTSEARSTLERVVNTYPNSAVATLAAEKLRELRR